MEASKVTISGETLKAHVATLDKKRKTELRREAIKAYINGKPAGTVIKTANFQAIGGFNSEANAAAFINRMVRDKVIGKQLAEGSKRSFNFWVIEPDYTPKDEAVNTEAMPNQVGLEPDFNQAVAEAERARVENKINDHFAPSKFGLIEAAREYAWRNNSDSLRDFINWYVR
jgi:hypothetical protein